MSTKSSKKASAKTAAAASSSSSSSSGFGCMTKFLVIAAVVVAVLFVKTDLAGNGSDRTIFGLLRNQVVNSSAGKQLEEYLARNEDKLNSAEQDSSMVNLYYNLATDFYEYGWSQSFHFAHTMEAETHEASLVRHEQRLADVVGIKKGNVVLDVGCGVGGPARNIAKHTQAHVTGVTINDYQVQRGRNHTEKAGLSHLVTHKQMDFTNLTLPEASFDYAYAIEATCHATDLFDVYKEVFRVMKPGGRFGTYEWLATPLYDKNNEEHKKIMRLIEIGDGLPPMHTADDVRKAAAKAGFKILTDVDLALDTQGTRPWYSKLASMNQFSIGVTHAFTWLLETFRLAPVGSTATHNMLIKACVGLVPGGELGIFTPMHLFVMEKPAAK